ncbi:MULTISPECIES: phosphodiester glycosidase family protein [Roseobacteraceae]|uniref:Phosphodiester glycosidase n=1 Tax=Pseudosulfitobacter pseudonitzschiae TaxID=1402135 RepID=A0A221K4A8_9RHOB|nr:MULTISPECIES: phosphodiester glycosidase family protein [Roseobacteraceae]ASM73703.1 phosphodiester glycosidase [Pseudosulfitobacter pseudonitzschiae]
MRAALIGALVWLACGPVWAASCENHSHLGNSYTVCTVDLTKEDLRLFLRDDDGNIYGSFNAINQALGTDGKTLGFAMNAGMYHEDRAPVGLYLEDGQQEMGLVSSAGPGNFGLLPNGVLCLRKGRAQVIETLRFAREKPTCADATQSGPMLVIDGELHPRFLVDSTSRYVRNGVGTTANGRNAVFVISNNLVSFYDFGSFFRDVLKLPQALYFDGNVSRLYAPDLGRHDPGRRLGPIIGTVASNAP